MKRYRRMLALVLVLSVFALANASCMGEFALSHKLYDWNKGLNKWLGSFLLFLFIVIPVYGVTLLIDWIILNVIEFYGGSNPINSSAEPTVKTTTLDGSKVTMTMRPGDALSVDIVSENPDGSVKTLIVRETKSGRLDARVVESHRVTSRVSAELTEDGLRRDVDGKVESFDHEQIAEVWDASVAGTRLAVVAP